MHQHNNPKGSSAIGLTRQASHAGHSARNGTEFATHAHTHKRRRPPGIVLAGCGIAAMTIGLLLAEPWTPVSESRATTIAAASPAVVTTSSTSSPTIVTASNLMNVMPAVLAGGQPAFPSGPPATHYAVIDIGPLGDMRPELTGDRPPDPDRLGTMGINNLGEVVYARNVNGTVRAFVWLPNANYGLACGLHDLNDLAKLSLERSSIARDINDAGQIVGQLDSIRALPDQESGDVPLGTMGVVWRLDLPLGGNKFNWDAVPFPGDGGRWVAPHAISNHVYPIVVGTAQRLKDCECEVFDEDILLAWPFSWLLGATALDEHEPSTILGPSGNSAPASQAEARDVNTLDQFFPDVVGRSFCGIGGIGCITLDEPCGQTVAGNVWPMLDSNPLKLPELATAREVSGRGINDPGRIVGFGKIGTQQCPRRALFWVNATSNPVNLGADSILEGIEQDGFPTRAEAINNWCRQQVVGWNEDLNRAIVWNRVDPDEIDETAWEALDLSNAIRECDDEWRIREAHDINDHGWIAAWGFNLTVDPQQLVPHAVVLIPVLPSHIPGDVNFDGIVNVLDLLMVISNWSSNCENQVECEQFCIELCAGDASGDCNVNVQDLLLVISHWGHTEPIDPCEFRPDLECTSQTGGGPAPPTSVPFQDVLDAWNFDDWEEAFDWMETADPQDVQDFLDDLEDAANQM